MLLRKFLVYSSLLFFIHIDLKSSTSASNSDINPPIVCRKQAIARPAAICLHLATRNTWRTKVRAQRLSGIRRHGRTMGTPARPTVKSQRQLQVRGSQTPRRKLQANPLKSSQLLRSRPITAPALRSCTLHRPPPHRPSRSRPPLKTRFPTPTSASSSVSAQIRSAARCASSLWSTGSIALRWLSAVCSRTR